MSIAKLYELEIMNGVRVVTADYNGRSSSLELGHIIAPVSLTEGKAACFVVHWSYTSIVRCRWVRFMR